MEAKIGWFCSYTPVEIIDATGFKAVRLYGSQEPPRRADAFLPTNICSFVKGCLDAALAGHYSNLAGVVIANSCNAMGHLYHALAIGTQIPLFLLDVPRYRSHEAAKYYAACLKDLSEWIVSLGGSRLTVESLAASVINWKLNRSLMSRLFSLQVKNPAPIAGSMLFCLLRQINAGEEGSREKAKQILESSSSLPGDKPELSESASRPRLVIAGTTLDSAGKLLEIVEQCGADVVADDTCPGYRGFANIDIPIQFDLDKAFMEISNAYLGKVPCPRMNDFEQREAELFKLIKLYDANGIIFYVLKFCDLMLYDIPFLRNKLAEKSIPCLVLSGEYFLQERGQLTTRIQAFLESLTTKRGHANEASC